MRSNMRSPNLLFSFCSNCKVKFRQLKCIIYNNRNNIHHGFKFCCALVSLHPIWLSFSYLVISIYAKLYKIYVLYNCVLILLVKQTSFPSITWIRFIKLYKPSKFRILEQRIQTTCLFSIQQVHKFWSLLQKLFIQIFISTHQKDFKLNVFI